MKQKVYYLVMAVLLICATSCQNTSKPNFEGSQDIGDVKIAGSMSYDDLNDTYTLNAAGLNLWEKKDAFYFVWKKVKGDFIISGDVAFEGVGVNPHRKIGFMIREKLSADSRYADIAVHGDGLNSLQYREIEGNITKESESPVKAPTSISLIREGNKISVRTGKGSLPETDDTFIEMNLPEECYVGMFMCSHEDDVMETGYISNVKLIVK